MTGKWFCRKCGSWTEDIKNRCSFCSNPKPIFESERVPPPVSDGSELKPRIHSTIEKLTPLQCKKMWRFIEDNFI
jgi:hypothetical protein